MEEAALLNDPYCEFARIDRRTMQTEWPGAGGPVSGMTANARRS